MIKVQLRVSILAVLIAANVPSTDFPLHGTFK